MTANDADGQDREGKAREARVDRLEWIIGWVSAALVLGLLGFLALEAVTEAEGNPVLRAEPGAPLPVDGGFVVPVRVRNSGDSTGADVTVEGVLTVGEGLAETASATLGYVAPDSFADAGLMFRGDPAAGTLEVRVTSYTAP